MTEPEDRPLRQAVRGLVIDDADRVLLVKQRQGEWLGWVLPGGGIDPGEDHEAALRRELKEETGLVDAFIGPLVCTRRQIGPAIASNFGGQHDYIYLSPCRGFEPNPSFSEEVLIAEGVEGVEWFTLDELRATTDKVVPRRLAELIERVLEFGGSVEPLAIEVIERSER